MLGILKKHKVHATDYDNSDGSKCFIFRCVKNGVRFGRLSPTA